MLEGSTALILAELLGGYNGSEEQVAVGIDQGKNQLSYKAVRWIRNSLGGSRPEQEGSLVAHRLYVLTANTIVAWVAFAQSRSAESVPTAYVGWIPSSKAVLRVAHKVDGSASRDA